MTARPLRALALLAALSLPSAAAAQPAPPPAGEATTLRLRFRAGSTARYATRTVQTSGGGAQATQTTSTAVIAVETLAVTPAGDAQQRMRFERMTLENPALPAAVRDRVSRALVGAAIGYTQGPRGDITAREAATGVAAEMRPILDATMQSLDQMGAQLPERAVRVGERWSERRTMHLAPIPGTSVDMRYETEYTLRALRPDGAAVLGVAVTLSTPDGASVAGIPFRGEGRAEGETVIDLARGAVRESRTTGEMTVHLTVRGRTVDVPSRFENEMRLEPPRAR